MQDEQHYSILLTHEELLFLIDTLKIPFVLGVGYSPVRQFESIEARRLISAGLNSLIARGFVQLPNLAGQSIQIESVLIAYMYVCATAKKVIQYARVNLTAESMTGFVHFGDHLSVIHSTPYPGVHCFTGAVALESIRDHLLHLFDSAVVSQNDDEIVTIPLRKLRQAAIFASDNNIAASIAELRDTGVKAGLADRIVGVLHSQRAKTVICRFVQNGEGDSFAETWACIENDTEAWFLDADGQEEEKALMHLELCTDRKLLYRIQEMLNFGSTNLEG